MLVSRDTLEHVIARELHISATVQEKSDCFNGYCTNLLKLGCMLFVKIKFQFNSKLSLAHLDKRTTMEGAYPWPRFIVRMFRQFNADVIVNAPKDRTLFNYNIKVNFFLNH